MADSIETVRGKRAVIRFESKKCIHSRHCVLDRPDVFVPNVSGEWIHPDSATPDELTEIARNCPSGAIQVERLDGGEEERPPLVNVVRVRENGPLAFRAPLRIGGVDAGLRATLCRCGHRRTNPIATRATSRRISSRAVNRRAPSRSRSRCATVHSRYRRRPMVPSR
jgi:uncharacterized Fe-S cluster protein YjdI